MSHGAREMSPIRSPQRARSPARRNERLDRMYQSQNFASQNIYQ